MAEPTKQSPQSQQSSEPRKISGRPVVVRFPPGTPLNLPTATFQVVDGAYARKHNLGEGVSDKRADEIWFVQGVGIGIKASIGAGGTKRAVSIIVPWASIGSVEVADD